MQFPLTPRLPEKWPEDHNLMSSTLNLIFVQMWNDLIRIFGQPGILSVCIVDTVANQGNYPAASYPEGAFYFASNTHNLYVDSYSTGTPTWTQVV